LLEAEQLMLMVAKGDLEAFNEIVLRHQGFVWAIAYRFLGDSSDAEDITQETFLRALQAASRYHPSSDFRGYLYRIVSRLCIDHARKKRPTVSNKPLDAVDPSPDPSAALCGEERDEEVRRALDSLPPRQRMAIVLKYYEGLNYAGIARAMGTTVKAVERLLGRARATLRSALSRTGEI